MLTRRAGARRPGDSAQKGRFWSRRPIERAILTCEFLRPLCGAALMSHTTHCAVVEPDGLEFRRSEVPTSGVYELWTHRSIYHLDEELRCIEVQSTADRRSQPLHPCRGATFSGARMHLDGQTKILPSLPPRGACAIFTSKDETVSITTGVQRIIKNIFRR